MSEVLKKFGRYFLLDRVAQGGMAEIYRARLAAADGAGRLLVIKRIQAGYGTNEDFVQMFKAEIKVTMGFNHPNIVQLYDFGEEQGQPYIAMEFVDGRNLRQFLSRFAELKQTFPFDLAAYIIEQAAGGLQYAHGFKDKITGEPLHIIHRDISPQNILISYEGSVKVIDFGIAKASNSSESTRAGVIKGKPSYLSPEQISGEPLDGRCDIFALGIVAWELLTGRKLFAGENDLAVLKLIDNCNTTVKPPSAVNPDVPKELDYVVLKALAKSREKRYQSAEEFRRACHKFIYGYNPDFNPADLAYFAKDLFKHDIVEDRKRIQKLNDKAEQLLVEPGTGSIELRLEPVAGRPVASRLVGAGGGAVGAKPNGSMELNVIEPVIEIPPAPVSAPPAPIGGTVAASTQLATRGTTVPNRPATVLTSGATSLTTSLTSSSGALTSASSLPAARETRIEVTPGGAKSEGSGGFGGTRTSTATAGSHRGGARAIPRQKAARGGYLRAVVAMGALGAAIVWIEPSIETTLGPSLRSLDSLGQTLAAKIPMHLNAMTSGASSKGVPAGAVVERHAAAVSPPPKQAMPAKLEIAPSGDDVIIQLNGSALALGAPSLSLPLDTPLELTVQKPGFHPFRREFVIPTAEAQNSAEYKIEVQLEPLRFGFLTVHSTPSSDATLIPVAEPGRRQPSQVNGAIASRPLIFKTPFENARVPSGTYNLHLGNDVLGMDKTVTIVVREGKILTVDERLDVKN